MKNYISLIGLEKLQKELKSLLTIERPKVVDVVSWAASNGDRSENGDYIYGKKKLRQIDSRIRYLTKSIKMAEPVDLEKNKHKNEEKIYFGASVWFRRSNDSKIEKIVILGKDEINYEKKHVSWVSPVSKALLGKKKGETTILIAPEGEIELEIVNVAYNVIE